ncbi:MAG: hypothetical protein IPJ30_25785 [Acidobacteria bacterium]|nr:hypothetical protein [Acidobacteriota bacterium]
MPKYCTERVVEIVTPVKVYGLKFSSMIAWLGRRTRKCGSAVMIKANVCIGVVTEIFESNSKVPRRRISPRLSICPSGETAHRT